MSVFRRHTGQALTQSEAPGQATANYPFSILPTNDNISRDLRQRYWRDIAQHVGTMRVATA
jgi:hypothetical protein